MRFGLLQHPRLAALLMALMGLPAWALAAGGENVQLVFTQQDMVYLYISAGFGALALIAGWIFRRQVFAQSPGDEKMQEVGKAIQDGAKAYLSQQVRTMAIFVLILAIGLFFMYSGQYSQVTAIWVAGSFVLGVAASYIAGYVGMDVAVAANMRTANAALTSYRRALEIAFRSGAVAGMMTVGMGLLGATAIFLFAGSEAMRVLVGFGFGGSLAALFMRVGGGIYTKAADVGADLVGKVEAGIPEDDPRNPAVIADNVGDNVGDCAGMAADVFESYEVTLVAAIVLGAATAAIFDQATWMRLVIFALMARGVGILASIIGILMVKGSDDVNTDPLKPITRGFQLSALFAALMTAGLAWYLMGGDGKSPIVTNQLTSKEQIQFEEVRFIKDSQARIAKEKDKKEWEIQAADLEADAGVQKRFPTQSERSQAVSMGLGVPRDQLKEPDGLDGYTEVNVGDAKNPVSGYATVYQPLMTEPTQQPPAPQAQTLAERYGKAELEVYKIEITTTPPAVPNQPAPTPSTETFYYGPTPKEDFTKLLESAKKQNPDIKVSATYPVTLFANSDGKIVAGVDDPKGELPIHRVTGPPMNYFKATKAELAGFLEKQKADPMAQFMTPESMAVVRVSHIPVPWWKFFVCILFGILMAFIFERLTDYYVSTHKKPVKEVADVATAGPAPMIIQGTALGMESSVFSLFAIVACLIMPLVVFPPAEYNGYLLSFYGIALVGLGLLTTTGYILAMDTFGPISDNAQGVFEMSGAGHANPEASKGVQRLDAAGNTTKALTKGFAIATAVVAAVALFHAYVESAKLTGIGMPLEVPEIFLGLLIGGAAPFLFAAFSINAVGRAAMSVVVEVRRQFKADPGIMAGTSKPDYGRCVAIVTAAAQKELIGPGILAIGLPVLVAFGFSMAGSPVDIGGKMYNVTGAQALGGFLAGTILSGQLLAVMLANSGGIWDNAKKLIEDGLHGGKGTEAHKAGVVCDTVGDPFKDTAGPALNPLIKVMNLIALLLVPVIIVPREMAVYGAITAVAALALIVSIVFSKRGSIGSEMAAASAKTDALPTGQPVAAPKAEESEKTEG
jgi:K(+)-stimulated pyrophosphate-energized sodium pump